MFSVCSTRFPEFMSDEGKPSVRSNQPTSPFQDRYSATRQSSA